MWVYMDEVRPLNLPTEWFWDTPQVALAFVPRSSLHCYQQTRRLAILSRLETWPMCRQLNHLIRPNTKSRGSVRHRISTVLAMSSRQCQDTSSLQSNSSGRKWAWIQDHRSCLWLEWDSLSPKEDWIFRRGGHVNVQPDSTLYLAGSLLAFRVNDLLGLGAEHFSQWDPLLFQSWLESPSLDLLMTELDLILEIQVVWRLSEHNQRWRMDAYDLFPRMSLPVSLSCHAIELSISEYSGPFQTMIWTGHRWW